MKVVRRTVIRDGKTLVKIQCPQCGLWGDADDEQNAGKVSLVCDCGAHFFADPPEPPKDTGLREYY